MNKQSNLNNQKHFSFVITMLSSLFSSSLLFILTASFAFNNAFAISSSQYSAVPPTSAAAGTSTPPLTMLVMSNDHQLFYKAYSDWSDLDGDGSIENSYKHSFDYYGYFDSYKCYDYDNTVGSERFSPQAVTTDKYCNSVSGSWSGNFLNWGSMTRMDIMRKVLYGGKRSTDTATSTVLERAFLPTDAHSFAKYYAGSDINKLTPYSPSVSEITMCNTTYDSGSSLESQNSSAAPLLRAVKGDFRFWAANERWQCTWSTERTNADNGYTTDPVKATDGLTADDGPDYIVKVETCVSSALQGKEKCNSYPDGNLKPIGLLHEYGENDQILFGLLTGSYDKNKSGGSVRKDITAFSNEVNVATNGTFTGVAGIVKTIDLFRIHGYLYGDGNGDGLYNSTDTCPYGKSEFLEGNCSNWGNPATEMYLEAVRYFAGLNKTNAFATNANDDTTYITGLTNVGNWTDPLDATNYCASCSIIVLNTSDFSYDSDSLSLTGLDGSPVLDTFTNAIGVAEGLTVAGSTWFVGENGADNNQLCTAKTVTNMSQLKGSCPNSPRLEGSYQMAGIAHYANTNDIRGLTDEQNVQTFSVSLASSAPQLKIPVQDASGSFIDDKFINIIPACRDTSMTDLSGSSLPGNCAIVDFKIITPFTQTGSGNANGSVAVIWEDTEQGGDYDQDVAGVLSYSITPTTITVTTNAVTDSTGYAMAFGYVIGGTTQDGFRAHSGANAYTGTDPDGLNDCAGGCSTGTGSTNETYTIGTSTGQLIKDPLWYAAKWGGFTDTDGDSTPNLTAEWDRINNETEATTPDGIPDNYFKSDNPSVLVSQLGKIFGKLLKRTSAGSAAAVITDSISTVGSVYQAIYQPKREKLDNEVSWIGQIYSVFIDAYGHLREDTDEDGTLDTTDKYILIKYSTDFERTQVWYCTPTSAEKISGTPFADSSCPTSARKELDDFKPVWNANHELAKFTATDSRLLTQRDYATAFDDSSNGGRHILTWQDLNGDDDIDSGEVVPFVAANFNETSSGLPIKGGLLGVTGTTAGDITQIENIVNFVRGYEDPATTGFRSRTIDFRPASGDEVWRMGDIIHSSPIAVGPPEGTAYGGEFIQWDTFGDSTYTNFKDHYKDRRIVLYSGGNDGLIHAFNGGFYNPSLYKYCIDPNCVALANSQPLGAELWAYAPKNLLPQLQFLTETDYPHVYYMDGEPRTFDVNIFPKTGDADHPDGWGTILVVGMRFGGGAHSPITVDVDGDNTGTTTFTTNSAYVILDVTNPEVAPTVLGEFTHPDLGFTTSAPTLLVKRSPDDLNDWSAAGTGSYPNTFGLVFGSGPNLLSTGLSNQRAKLFMVKLELSSGVLDLSSSNQKIFDTTIDDSFIGSPTAKNWDNDFSFDSVYFGVAGGTETNPNGSLMRVSLNTNDPTNWTLSTMLDSGQPFLNMPVAKRVLIPDTDIKERWVYAGTGRLYTTQDNYSSTQQSFYGFREEESDASKLFSLDPADTTDYLQNITGVRVFQGGQIIVPGVLSGELTMSTFDALEFHVQNNTAGWHKNFTIPGSSERDLARATLYTGLVIFPTYTPNTNICLAEGNSTINAVYLRTGTGHPDGGYTDPSLYFPGDSTNKESLVSYNYGFGLVSEITMKKNADGSSRLVCTTSTGEICNTIPPDEVCTGSHCNVATGRQSWQEIPLY